MNEATRCRILIGPHDARIYAPYAARALIKELPGRARRWDKALTCWVTPVAFAGEIRARLEDAGYHVAVIRVDTPSDQGATA